MSTDGTLMLYFLFAHGNGQEARKDVNIQKDITIPSVL